MIKGVEYILMRRSNSLLWFLFTSQNMGAGSGKSYPPDHPATTGRPDGSCPVHPAGVEGRRSLPMVRGGPADSAWKDGAATRPRLFLSHRGAGEGNGASDSPLAPSDAQIRRLKKIVDNALGGGLFEKVPQKIDQAAVYVPKEKEKDIPHYTEINYRGTGHILLVTVPGRRTQCRHCTGTDHWSNRCPQGENRTQNNQRPTFAEKVQKKQTKTTKPTPTATTTTTTTKTASSGGEAEADVETEDEGTTWSVVAPRRKRKRQGPTPRTSPACPAAEDSFYERALQSDQEEDNNDDNNSGDNNGDDNNAQQDNENRNGGNNDNNNTSDDEARNGGQDENNS